MKIAIRDPEKTSFWSLPGTSLQLSYLNPGPIEFDPTGLSPQQRQILWVSLARQTLACEGANQLIDLIRPPAPPPKPVEDPVSAMVIQVEEVVQEVKPEIKSEIKTEIASEIKTSPSFTEVTLDKTKELKNLLKHKITVLQKELLKKSASELKTLLEFEKSWKNRKSVVKLVQELLKNKEDEVMASIEALTKRTAISAEEFNKQEISKGIKRDLLQNLEDIVDSDVETIQIPLGVKTD